MRCFLWPCSVPNDLICRCGQLINLNHLFNCKFNITYRSVVHDAVRGQLYAMCKSHHIEAFGEPLVRRLSSENEDENTFGKRRADLITPASVNENSHPQYNLCPFVFSLLGSLGKAAMAFLEDFVVVVKERTGRIFNRVYWQNRIVFFFSLP
ncbi:hypothetical protein P9112_003728 [Eukaryota sp. TZLM1-RC]